MNNKLPFRIYTASGELRGCALHAEDAASLLSLLGDGATLHHDDVLYDAPIWTEGVDGYAYHSYDFVASVAHARIKRANFIAPDEATSKEEQRRIKEFDQHKSHH